MARSFEQILADAKAKRFDERAKNIRGSYRFDVAGKGSYRMEVDHGKVSFREDRGPAECVIAADADDFARIIDGEQNVLTAYMQGRVQVDGNLGLAKVFHGAIGIARTPEVQQP
ncbi:MAG: SCP2 sterol-binding domain-containing protein [Myxococcales bacterium]